MMFDMFYYVGKAAAYGMMASGILIMAYPTVTTYGLGGFFTLVEAVCAIYMLRY
jgi:tRNA A37 threonylcarbamoyladenosine synthetase subunit TsaC/SUA5/YrdC